MKTLKEFYKSDMSCNDCIHKNVCNVRTCFEENHTSFCGHTSEMYRV